MKSCRICNPLYVPLWLLVILACTLAYPFLHELLGAWAALALVPVLLMLAVLFLVLVWVVRAQLWLKQEQRKDMEALKRGEHD